jgi:hypothetical protein
LWFSPFLQNFCGPMLQFSAKSTIQFLTFYP